jgi:hypothetical protein
MTTRRSFLRQGGAAAGALAIGCNRQETTTDATKEAAVAAPPSTHTLELVIGGLFLFVEDQTNNLVHILAPATGSGHVPHDMLLVFSNASKRPAQKLSRARIDLSSLAQGLPIIPSAMLDLNDVVYGRRLRMPRKCINDAVHIAHHITIAGGAFSKVTEECCILPNRNEPVYVTGRVQWSCPVNEDALTLDIQSLDGNATTSTGAINAESGRIQLGLVHGDPKEGLPADVEELRSKEYPGNWNHFKAFYQCWSPNVTPAAPRACTRAGLPLAPSQCGPGRVAAEP